jgi:hypothetical protein
MFPFFFVAEAAGFEPADLSIDNLANCSFKPLTHASVKVEGPMPLLVISYQTAICLAIQTGMVGEDNV